jgi:uncharacterized membrane protein
VLATGSVSQVHENGLTLWRWLLLEPVKHLSFLLYFDHSTQHSGVVVRVMFLAKLDALFHHIFSALFQLLSQPQVYPNLSLQLLFKRQGGPA